MLGKRKARWAPGTVSGYFPEGTRQKVPLPESLQGVSRSGLAGLSVERNQVSVLTLTVQETEFLCQVEALILHVLPFQMIIYCDVKEFKVAINGVHSLEYKHRLRELANIDTLEVDGDIHLLEVRSW